MPTGHWVQLNGEPKVPGGQRQSLTDLLPGAIVSDDPGHATHGSELENPERYVPGGQRLQTSAGEGAGAGNGGGGGGGGSGSASNPGWQRQLDGKVAPIAESVVEFAPHASHGASPIASLNESAAQSMHSPSPFPSSLQPAPTLQMQSTTEVAPGAVVVVPATHAVHSAVLAGEYAPRGQS